MYDFVSHILRRYFEATQWNEYNSYLNLTASSAAILDFPVPTGLSLSISASPSPPFFTTYRLGALPNLRAGIGYIYASTDNPLNFGASSKDVRFKDVIERFRIVESPKRPQGKDHTWLAGKRIDSNDFLIYGCMHVPSSRLDALYTSRLSPTWQLIVTAVSTPPKYPLTALQNAATSASMRGGGGMSSSLDKLDPTSSTASLHAYGAISASTTGSLGPSSGNTTAAANASSSAPTSTPSVAGAGPPGSTNLQLTLQRDTGKWFTEYSYSVDDALWGFRVLHNFGDTEFSSSSSSSSSSSASSSAHHETADSSATATSPSTPTSSSPNRIDESGFSLEGSSSDAGGGLRGRFSAGAEVFVSTVEKSAGLSTGIRFSTLPDTPIITPAKGSNTSSANTNAGPSQPPTVITATLNPMMGHLSTAYAARMAKDVVVCSRFDFNVYSYDSEWTVGAEYWLRASPPRIPLAPSAPASPTSFGLNKPSLHNTTTIREMQSRQRSERETLQAPPIKMLSLREESNSSSPSPADAEEEARREQIVSSASASLRAPPAAASDRAEVDSDVPTLAPHQTLKSPANTEPSSSSSSPSSSIWSPITGVLKARISTTSDIRLLWQGRLRNCLVSLGVKADLNNQTLTYPSSSGIPSSSTNTNTKMRMNATPTTSAGIVKSIGVEIMYFSSADGEPALAQQQQQQQQQQQYSLDQRSTQPAPSLSNIEQTFTASNYTPPSPSPAATATATAAQLTP